MAITHKMDSREETITENVRIIFSPEWEEETAIEEVSLKIREEDKEEEIKLGGYFIDTVAGERSWVEYNSKCVVFFNGNRYTDTVFITKIFDIEKRKFIEGTIQELAEYYALAFKDEIQSKVLKNNQTSSNE